MELFGKYLSEQTVPASLEYLRDYLPEYARAHHELSSVFQQLMLPIGRELDDLADQSFSFIRGRNLRGADTREADWIYSYSLKVREGEVFQWDRDSLITPGIIGDQDTYIKPVETYREFRQKASPSRYKIEAGVKMPPASLVASTPLIDIGRIQPFTIDPPSPLVLRADLVNEEAQTLVTHDIDTGRVTPTRIEITGLTKAWKTTVESIMLLNGLDSSTRNQWREVTKIELTEAPAAMEEDLTILTIPTKLQQTIDGTRELRHSPDIFMPPILSIDNATGGGRWPIIETTISEEGGAMDILRGQHAGLPVDKEVLVVLPLNANEPNSTQELPTWIDFALPSGERTFKGMGFRNFDTETELLVATWRKQPYAPSVIDGDGTALLSLMNKSAAFPMVNFFPISYNEITIENSDQALANHLIKIPIRLELDTPREIEKVKRWSWSIIYPDGTKKYITTAGEIVADPVDNNAVRPIEKYGLGQNDTTVEFSITYQDLLDWRNPDDTNQLRTYGMFILDYDLTDDTSESVYKIFRFPFKAAEILYGEVNQDWTGGPSWAALDSLNDWRRARLLYKADGEDTYAVLLGGSLFKIKDQFDLAMIDTNLDRIYFRESYDKVEINFGGE